MNVIKDTLLNKAQMYFPDFEIDSSHKEWVYDVNLKDTTDQHRKWIAHVEISLNDNSSYNYRIGVFSKELPVEF